MANLLGYAASCAVLATFLMRTMMPLRLVAILSNLLFLTYGYIQHIYPVFFLHMALMPINVWRLFTVWNSIMQGQESRPAPAQVFSSSPPFWFVIGLLADVAGPLIFIVVKNPGHI